MEDRSTAPSPYALTLRDALNGSAETITRMTAGEVKVHVIASYESIFAVIRRSGGGGLAVRAAFIVGRFDARRAEAESGEAARVVVTTDFGEYVISFSADNEALERLRITTRFTPSATMLMPPMPRDLYALGADGDVVATSGEIEARQRGLNAGILYFRLSEPPFGNVLYMQNLTALNPYFEATGTKPEAAVGGTWPELGFRLPTPEEGATEAALVAGVEYVLSDAILVLRHEAPPHERESARQFLQMLGAAYQLLDLPAVEFRDWVGRAEKSAHDLDTAPAATIEHYGHRYVHPYTGAEYPDVMVQMSVIAALHGWGEWRGEAHPLEAQLKAGLRRFYDPQLRTIRRYLPNVGDDKNADAVDSWYMYHPLLNLGILALGEDEEARNLFLDSIDFAVRAARHFKYRWPIQYDITDFSVIDETAPADGRGQTDVGGIYAWVMLQAFELTDDKMFLDEARAAIDAAMGLRFNVNYQANLTAWGATACMRLWRVTNDEVYREQSYVYLASFFHNSIIWDSRIGHAKHYETFLAVTCLQDAPYMAMYECFDTFVAFERFCNDSGPDLEPAARMLVSEYCKYALSRAWYYYPDALPADVIADQQRENNGHVDGKLSFPLEDLYPDGQCAGQVGQEVYGAGAAFIFATRAFHPVEGAPFQLFCDHFVRAMERTGDRALTITLDGGETCAANLRLVRLKRRKLPKSTVRTATGDSIRPNATTTDRIDYRVPAAGRLVLTWE
ncbi:hypothetical protein KCP91_17930 [Microvirga sp. SRT01]|uniref:Uncharacterized protein n=1 Tax=Sphingomonas longa TaxID=2778730 RepID=A0ABS2DBF8_9SPHN|nr:hypothetical protein [Microvirga sp. SRT01]MBM6578269.1 hypothetical protein [Sphingomonas sp. BT552]MBR7711310.1 hypothetical protein [Microvirga sp. SRT01]